MVQWPDLNLPPINLYNAPILVAYREKSKAVRLNQPANRINAERVRRRQVNSLAQLLAMPH